MNENINLYFKEHPTYTMTVRTTEVADKVRFYIDIRDSYGTCMLQLMDWSFDAVLDRINKSLGESPYV